MEEMDPNRQGSNKEMNDAEADCVAASFFLYACWPEIRRGFPG
jgi:hypothetical protein